MRAKYSIGDTGVPAAAASAGAECPPVVVEVAREVAALRAVPAPFSPPCRLITPDAAGEGARPQAAAGPADRARAVPRGAVAARPVDETPASRLPAPSRLLRLAGPRLLRAGRQRAGDRPARFASAEPRAVSSGPTSSPTPPRSGPRGLPRRLLAMRARQRRAACRLGRRRGRGDAGDDAAFRSGGRRGTSSWRPRRGGDGGPGGDWPRGAGRARTSSSRTCSSPTPPGSRRCCAAYRGGGWAAVDRLLRRPPGLDRRAAPPRPPGSGSAARRRRPARAPGRAGTRSSPTPSASGRCATWLARRLPAERAAALAAGWDGDRIRLVRAPRRTRRAGRWRGVVRCRTVADRQALEAALQAHLPGAPGPTAGRRPPPRAGVVRRRCDPRRPRQLALSGSRRSSVECAFHGR